jgi:hypothetical protein
LVCTQLQVISRSAGDLVIAWVLVSLLIVAEETGQQW